MFDLPSGHPDSIHPNIIAKLNLDYFEEYPQESIMRFSK